MQQPVRLSWSPWGTVSGGGHVNRDVSQVCRAPDWLRDGEIQRGAQQPARKHAIPKGKITPARKQRPLWSALCAKLSGVRPAERAAAGARPAGTHNYNNTLRHSG